MQVDRKVLEQALELLQSAHVATALVWPRHDCVEALKAALEQREQGPIPFSGADEKPPVFGRRWRIAKDGFGLQLDDEGPYVHIDDALSVLHAALEQPKQEEPDVEYYGLEPWEVPQHIPFATAIYPAHSPDKPFLALGDCAHMYRDAAKCAPLYAHPPRKQEPLCK